MYLLQFDSATMPLFTLRLHCEFCVLYQRQTVKSDISRIRDIEGW